MKYLTTNLKDFVDCVDSGATPIDSADFSMRPGFNEKVLRRVHTYLSMLDLDSILSESNLPLKLKSSIRFHIKFFLTKKFFIEELEEISGLQVWPPRKNPKFRLGLYKIVPHWIVALIRYSGGFFSLLVFKYFLAINKGSLSRRILVFSASNGLAYAVGKLIMNRDVVYFRSVRTSFFAKISEFLRYRETLPFFPLLLFDTSQPYDGNIFRPGCCASCDFENELRVLIHNWIDVRLFELNCIEVLVRTLQPKVFFAQHSLDCAATIAIVCHRESIPTVLASHGSHVLSDSSIAVKEWIDHSKTMLDGPFDFTLVQTPAAAAFADIVQPTPSVVRTAPILFGPKENSSDACRNKVFHSSAGDTIFLYASTPKSLDFLRPVIYESEDEYVRNLKVFLECVAGNPQIHVAVRHRPSNGLPIHLIEQIVSRYSFAKVYSQGDFDDLVKCCDVLVSYSSTAIEQALFYGKYVLSWSVNAEYHHLKVDYSAAFRGIYYANRKELSGVILKILHSVRMGTFHGDMDLQREYYLYLEEHKKSASALRNLFGD